MRNDAIGRDQQEPVAQVINVANLAPPLGDCSGTQIRLQQCHFLSTNSRVVLFRKSQLDGAAEIGPLMAKTEIW